MIRLYLVFLIALVGNATLASPSHNIKIKQIDKNEALGLMMQVMNACQSLSDRDKEYIAGCDIFQPKDDKDCNSESITLCATVDGKTVGAAVINDCILSSIFVLPEARGTQVAKELMNTILQRSTSSCSIIITRVDETNANAQKFYRRNGFKPTRNIIGHNEYIAQTNSKPK